MDEREWLTARFEEQRPHLRGVAYRLLGSTVEAEDAVQEAWLRLDRADAAEIENLGGWLTTVVARVSLNMLRSRGTRREEPFGRDTPEPLVAPAEGPEPEQEALVADSVGLALMVVLETLRPAERLAFVLHDVFGVPFEEIAPMVERSPAAARQLASRARRRVRGAAPAPDGGLSAQREVVEAFFAAGRNGDFAGLIAVLDPDVVLRVDVGDRIQGAEAVAGQAQMYSHREARHATVNGAAGAVILVSGRPTAVMGFTVVADRIVAIDVVADSARVQRLDLSFLD
jgi:RNA polymerase sigma factor (sigma-70 family)